jgi:hypothetical protein
LYLLICHIDEADFALVRGLRHAGTGAAVIRLLEWLLERVRRAAATLD